MKKPAILLSLAMTALPSALLAQENTQLPVAGEAATLDGFEAYYNKLKSDAEKRLGDLSANEALGLPKPDTSRYQGEIDRLSSIDMEIKLLGKMLEQAQLVKQVYQEVHSDKTEEYLAQISFLQDSLSQSESRIREMEDHLSNAERELAEKSNMAESLEARLADAVNQLEYANQMNDSPQQPYGSSRSSSSLLGAQPRVALIISIGSRFQAELVMPDGSYATYSAGDKIQEGMIIERIEQRKVFVKTSDGVSALENYVSYDEPEDAGSYSYDEPQNSGSFSPTILQDVAQAAND